MTNWAQVLATDLAARFEGVDVFSNIDPAREWVGKTTIEVNVNAIERVNLISASAFVDNQIVVACRALTYDVAAALTVELKDAIAELITSYKLANTINDGVITGSEVTPDIRGITEGASFYGVVNLTLTIKEL